MSAVVQRLQQLLEPVHPALVLNIASQQAEIEATVYEACGDFDPIETLLITTEVARSYLEHATRLTLDGDEIELPEFQHQLTRIDAGWLLPEPKFYSTYQVLVVTHPEAGVVGVYDTDAAWQADWLQKCDGVVIDPSDNDYKVEWVNVQRLY